MPSGKDFTTGKRTAGGKKNANCSFCRKSYREVGPLVEGPDDVYVCGDCIELCQSILEQAAAMADKGVVLREPLPKAELASELAGFRALLYRGDPGETYCLAVGEAQAVGVPSVVQDIGCVAERVIDGRTGFVALDDADFTVRARALLQDNDLWRGQQEAALANQRGWSWDDAAAAFEQFVFEKAGPA